MSVVFLNPIVAIFCNFRQLIYHNRVLKENQPRMWDVREYELAVPGRPTRARRVSVGRPGTASEYSRTSNIRG